jgi:glyoxylase-like metal-dependent hydrolase (beta-lactamase superfamily II)
MTTVAPRILIHEFFDPATFTLTYVVHDRETRDAVVIDPVLDYDPIASRTDTHSIRQVEAYLRANELRLHFVLETHAHADHLSGSPYLKKRFGARVVIGEQITAVQRVFRGIFGLGETFPVDGSQFDRLVADGESLEAGSLRIGVLAMPGHTPACVSYRIDDAVFTGDALFIEDYGTGRCDFPSGSADALFSSIQKLYTLPDETRVFVGHDYQPDGRPLRFETTIGASKRANVQITAQTSREDFVRLRNGRDATLAAPRLLFPSVQINVDAGRLPAPGEGGHRRLRVPLNLGIATDDDGTPT